MIDIRPIRTPKDYNAALEMIDKFWKADEGTEDYDRFEVLCILIQNYEKETWLVDLPDPIEALKYYMRQDGASVEELGLILNDQILAQKILKKLAPLTISILYELHRHWDYPVTPFLKPYKLVFDP